MKKMIFFITLLIPSFLMAQKNKDYSIFSIETQTLIFDSSLKRYAEKFQHSLSRDFSIDSITSLRTLYFLKVIANTSQNISFGAIFDNIPSGSAAHSRFFGTPNYFKEPTGIKYQEALPVLPRMGIYIKAEIMQQEYWSSESEELLSDKEIVVNALKGIRSSLGKDYLLSGYKGSKEHNSAIIKYGDGKYGTATKILVSKWLDESERVWKYEAIIINCTSFTKEIQ